MLLRVTEPQHCPKDIRHEFQTSKKAPKSFIDWHRKRAEEELTAICEFSGATIHNKWMGPDDWFDGFQSLHVVIETRGENIFKIKWHEGQECFVRKAPGSGAWLTMRPEEMDNQEFSDLMHALVGDSYLPKEMGGA